MKTAKVKSIVLRAPRAWVVWHTLSSISKNGGEGSAQAQKRRLCCSPVYGHDDRFLCAWALTLRGSPTKDTIFVWNPQGLDGHFPADTTRLICVDGGQQGSLLNDSDDGRVILDFVREHLRGRSDYTEFELPKEDPQYCW